MPQAIFTISGGNQITPKLPRILRELATQSSLTDDLWKSSAPVMRVLSRVSFRGHVDTPGRPSFNIAMWLDNTDVVTELVLSKTLKSYKAADPIELLAYLAICRLGVGPAAGRALSATHSCRMGSARLDGFGLWEKLR